MSSDSNVSIQLVDKVYPHPNADRLEIAEVSGYTVVTGKGNVVAGDTAIYFPPDNLIPVDVAEKLGVAQYLKHALYPGDLGKTKCRIGAARLRGVKSFGFLVPTESDIVGLDLNEAYKVQRYDPPIKIASGDQMQEASKFHRYTNIQNVQKYSGYIPEGTPVIYTEKIHGTNSRIGVIDGDIVAGSHNCQVKFSEGSLYWSPYEVCKELLEDMQNDEVDIIIFGEIFGAGVQDLHYGFATPTFRCFDISVDGEYLPPRLAYELCRQYEIPVVPILDIGRFSRARLEELTDGDTTYCPGHIREGVVVKAIEQDPEQFHRQILKSVSVDYLGRD